ncbi:MAG: metallophosphoesterase [Pseudomonadota bacterium]
MHRYLRPSSPFRDPSGDKGWLNRFTGAQNHITTRLPACPPGWDARKASLKLALLADLHMGSQAGDVARLEKIVDEVNNWAPDLVLLLGDFMNTQLFGGGRVPPETTAQILAALGSRLGTYAILGNHDWYYDGEAVRTALASQDITVLENECCRVADEAGSFFIAGLADEQTRQPEVDATLGRVPEGMPALIMAHDPATFANIPNGPYLTLCGHTHGGQIRLPFLGPVFNSSSAPLRWTAGYIVENEKHLFVSRGLGTSIVPVRLNCPPEVCLMTVGPPV